MTIHAQPGGATDLAGKTVLVSIDIETLVGGDGQDLAAALADMIGELTRRRARVIVLSDRGEAACGSFDPGLSLRPLAIALSRALDKVVTFIPGRVDAGSLQAIATVAEGGVGLLENLRFSTAEAGDDRELGRRLAGLGHYHINVSGGRTSPRASTSAIGEFMPSYQITPGSLPRRAEMH